MTDDATPPVFTKHALERMAKRRLQGHWVEQVVQRPSRVEPDPVDASLEHRWAPVPELDGRILRAIVSQSQPTRVITSHLDRKLKGTL